MLKDPSVFTYSEVKEFQLEEFFTIFSLEIIVYQRNKFSPFFQIIFSLEIIKK